MKRERLIEILMKALNPDIEYNVAIFNINDSLRLGATVHLTIQTRETIILHISESKLKV